MKTLAKMTLAGFVALQTLTFTSTAAEADWLTDLPKAQARAKEEKKLVLIDFTGSDWCPPCMALHKTVLTSPEFEAYAKTNLVLVVADFPRKKEQSEKLKKTNEALAKKFNIEGFPTIMLLNADGKELSKSVGYSGEKPKEFIDKLEEAKKKQ